MGSYVLGVRNDREERVMEFCQEHNLVITNSFFKPKPKLRLFNCESAVDAIPSVMVSSGTKCFF